MPDDFGYMDAETQLTNIPPELMTEDELAEEIDNLVVDKPTPPNNRIIK